MTLVDTNLISSFNAHFLPISISALSIIGISLITDSILIPQIFKIYHFFRALSDNMCHGLISIFSWVIVSSILNRNSSNYKILLQEYGLSYIFGSLIDLDHFLAANSISFIKATNLSTRPYGHCMIVGLSLILLSYFITSNKKISIQMFVAYISHMMRDSTRRGFWLIPTVSTSAISYKFQLFLLVVFPIVMSLFIHQFKVKIYKYSLLLPLNNSRNSFTV